MPRKLTRPQPVLIGGIVFLVLIAAALGWLAPLFAGLSRIALAIAAPTYGAAVGLRDGLAHALVPSDCSAQAANDETVQLRIENTKLKTLVAENESLKSALHFSETSDDDLLTARVIAESTDGVQRTFTIDRGSSDGIAAGQPVLVGDGLIAGKISDLRAHSALVILLEDPRSRLAVTVQNNQGTLGVLEGDGGLSALLTLIPQTELLSSGNTIITSGLENGIRRGYPVGTIDKVIKSTQDPFQSATITPFATSLHPTFVQVVRSPLGG